MKITLRGLSICLVMLGIMSFCFGAWFIYKSYGEHQKIANANEVLSQYDLKELVSKKPLTSTDESNLVDNGTIAKRVREGNVSFYSIISALWMSISSIFLGLSSILLAIPTIQNKENS